MTPAWQGPLVILGAPRSGTTLLRLMLTAHPAICIPPESRFMVEWQDSIPGSTGEAPNIDQLVQVLSCSKHFNEWELSEKEIRHHMEMAKPATRLDAMIEVHRLYRDKYQPGATIWGIKNPGYIFAVPFLRETFPEVRFLLLVRDPRAILASFHKLQRERAGEWERLEGQLHRIRRFAAKIAEIRREFRGQATFHEIRYEDLVADPGRILQGFCNWIGVEFDEQMLKYPEVRATSNWVAPRMVDINERVQRQPTRERIDSWRQELPLGKQEGAEIVLGPLLAELGYQPITWRPRLRGWVQVTLELLRNPSVLAAAVRARM